jgi:hypothetical protein
MPLKTFLKTQVFKGIRIPVPPGLTKRLTPKRSLLAFYGTATLKARAFKPLPDEGQKCPLGPRLRKNALGFPESVRPFGSSAAPRGAGPVVNMSETERNKGQRTWKKIESGIGLLGGKERRHIEQTVA